MKNSLQTPEFNKRLYLKIFLTLSIFALAIILLLYGFLHVVFYDVPFAMEAELPAVASLAGFTVLVAVGVSFLIFIVDAGKYIITHHKHFRLHNTVQVTEG